MKRRAVPARGYLVDEGESGETGAVTATEPAAVETSVSTTASAPVGDRSTRLFSRSILISAVRCLLTYIVFPWLLPALGVARGVGPGIGLAVGAVAIWFNVASIRRFWAADHPWKKPITVLNGAVIVLLLVLVGQDIGELLRG